MPSTRHSGRADHQALIRSHTASWTAGSRTTPLLPTASGPASNWGLINAIAQAPGAHSREWCGKQGRQPDEARIAHQRGDWIGDGVARQVARVGFLVRHDARIGAQLPRELAVTDIDCVHSRRAMRQQHVGEATGGGADVEADAACRREAEMAQRMIEFLATA